MPLLNTTRSTSTSVAWSTVSTDPLFEVQHYRLGSVGQKLREAKHTLKREDVDVGAYRIISTGEPVAELAVADTQDSIEADAEALRLYVAGVPGASITPHVQAALAAVADAAQVRARTARASTGEALDDAGRALAIRESTREHVDEKCLALLDSSDRMRYVVHALKVAGALSADVVTCGLGGEELVELLYLAVDAMAWSSWMTWFATNLLAENAAGITAVRGVLSMSWAHGPEGVIEQATALAHSLSADQAQLAMRLCNTLKKRVASVVGNLAALLAPNDAGVVGVVVTELLIRLSPVDCGDALAKLAGHYSKISRERREVLQDATRLTDLLQAAGRRVEEPVMREFNRTAADKLKHSAMRHGALTAAGVLFPPLMFANAAHLAASAALQMNCGRQACEQVFAAVQDGSGPIASGLQQILAVSFGAVALLDACAKRCSS